MISDWVINIAKLTEESIIAGYLNADEAGLIKKANLISVLLIKLFCLKMRCDLQKDQLLCNFDDSAIILILKMLLFVVHKYSKYAALF